jgi:hypothetical protein
MLKQKLSYLSNPLFWPSLFLLHLALRWSLLHTTFLDIDEAQFAGFARVLLDGGLPYRDSLDTKSLGIYLFYAACFKLFPANPMLGVRIITWLWSFAEAALLAAVLRQGLGQTISAKKIGRLAAFFFVIFSTTFIPKYLGTSINSVMILFLIGSVFFTLKAEENPNKEIIYDALSGFFVGLALLFKYQAGIQFFVFALFVSPLFPLLKTSPSGSRVIKRVIIFGLALCMPFALQGLLLWEMGVWTDFVQWSILGSGAYIVQGGSSISFWRAFLAKALPYLLSTSLIWFLAGLAIHSSRKKTSTKMPDAFRYGLLWAALTLIPVSLSGRFYGHYFLQILPAICLLAAFGFDSLDWTRKPLLKKSLIGILIILPTILFGILRWDTHRFNELFPDDSLNEQEIIGQRVRLQVAPNEKIFVWGFATAIYYHAHGSPMSRFLWTDLLVGRVPGASVTPELAKAYRNPKAWEAFWEDWHKNPPAVFVDTSPGNIHGYAAFPPKNYPELASEIAEHYELKENVLGAVIYRRNSRRKSSNF